MRRAITSSRCSKARPRRPSRCRWSRLSPQNWPAGRSGRWRPTNWKMFAAVASSGGTRGHGLRPAFPHYGPHLLAVDARIGTGLRPVQHQAGGRQLRRQGAAGGRDRRQGDCRGDRGDERSQGEFPGVVQPARARARRKCVSTCRPRSRSLSTACRRRRSPSHAPPLACKLRQRQDLPENLRQPWHTGLADYETLDAEARRRLAACGADDALRCLSSLVEEAAGRRGPAARSGLHGHRLAAAGRGVSSACAGRRTRRTFEPVTFHAMAHCLEQMGRTDLAIVYYELACGGQWDQRFGDMHNIAHAWTTRGSCGGWWPRMVRGKGDSPVFAETKIGTVPYARNRGWRLSKR